MGYLTGVPSALLASASTINTYVNDPTFKSYLDMVDVPKGVTIAFAVLGILIWLAHGRDQNA